jgi:predicted amidohydrolase
MAMAVPPDLRGRRDFIVAAWQEGRRREREVRQVQAKSHEEAVAVVAASQTIEKENVVYEVWPAQEPHSLLRITLGPRRHSRNESCCGSLAPCPHG